MNLDIQVQRKMKMDRHNEMLDLYHVQLAQLQAAIARRQKSVETIQAKIQAEDEKRRNAFSQRLYRSKDDAVSEPISVGERYRVGPDKLEIITVKGLVGIKFDKDENPVFSAGSIEALSPVFWFEYPTAVKLT